MKVKTLIHHMLYPVDIVEVYNTHFNLIDTINPEDAERCYGNNHLDHFNIYENNDGVVVLEVMLKIFD